MDQTKSLRRGLFLVRLALAIVFIVSGVMKLQHMDKTIAGFATLGFSAFFAYLVAIVEAAGGLLILLGKGVRIVGYLLAIIMLVAIVKVGWPKGFSGYEYQLVLLLCSLAVAIAGSTRQPPHKL